MRKSFLASIAAGTLLAMSLAAPAAADGHTNADLTIIHAVPGATVDVWVNGAPFITSFTPGTITDPVSLPAGDYNVSITLAGDPDESGALLTATLPLEAGKNYSAIAFLDAGGDLAITMFTNDISETAEGEGRLTVRHAAAAPAVDIWVNGSVLFPGLENPNEVMGDVPADTYEAAVSLAGTETVVLGPADVPIEAGVNTIVYAWGSAEAGNLALAIQTVPTVQPAPEMEEPAPVETEEPVAEEVVEEEDGDNTGLIIAIVAALAAAAIIATVIAKRRK